MTDPIRELKTRAELVQRALRRRDPPAIDRLGRLPAYRTWPTDRLVAAAATIRRHHCLALIARELGFSGWPHARAILSGARDVDDFGTLLYPAGCGGQLNLWYRRHADAVVGRQACDGYLLAYRRDVFVADRGFIARLGLDPDAPEWRRLGFDWVRPRDMAARRHLYAGLIAQRPREAS